MIKYFGLKIVFSFGVGNLIFNSNDIKYSYHQSLTRAESYYINTSIFQNP